MLFAKVRRPPSPNGVSRLVGKECFAGFSKPKALPVIAGAETASGSAAQHSAQCTRNLPASSRLSPGSRLLGVAALSAAVQPLT